MIVKRCTVHGWEEATQAIGLSYGKPLGEKRANELAELLVRRGVHSGEANFLTGVTVSMTIDASIKWWQQAERYHWFQIVMSESVMHSVAHTPIERMCFTPETPIATVEAFGEVIASYQRGEITQTALIYAVPVGLMERARVTTNYLQLLTMYRQRMNHKLPEWRNFCEQVARMPHMNMFL